MCICPSRLLTEKHSELGEQVSKLRNGLYQISEVREKVKAMSVELEETEKQVAKLEEECHECLHFLVRQKIDTDKHLKVGMANMFEKL